MAVTAAGASKGTAGSGGGGRQTLHHFFAKKPPAVAAACTAAASSQRRVEPTGPNGTSRVGSKIPTAPPTPPTPAPQPWLLQRGTPPTPPSRPMSPRTPPSPPQNSEVGAGGSTGGGDDRWPNSSAKNSTDNNNGNNGGIGSETCTPQQTSASGNGSNAPSDQAKKSQQQRRERKTAPIFVTPVPSTSTAKAAKKASAVDAAAAAVTRPAAADDEQDTSKETIMVAANRIGRKRPPLAPLFASPRSSADGLAMMTVTPSSCVVASATASTSASNGRKRPRSAINDSSITRPSTPPNATSNGTALSRSNSTVSSSSATTQLYLDLGQSNFAARSICPICGMMSVHGMAEDDAEHERICSEYRKGIAFAGWKSERVVGTFGLKSSIGLGLGMSMGVGMGIANKQGKDKSRIGASTSGRIVEVRPTDPVQHRKLVRPVKAIVDQELGFADSSTSAKRSSSVASGDFDFAQDAEDDDESSLFGRTAYLYVSNKAVVGFCTVEVIRSAHRLLDATPASDGQSSGGSEGSRNDMSDLHRSTKPTKAIMGVHQLWCHSSHRKGKVATRLVDAARSQLVYGMSVPHGMVAFSSPTVAGLTFAKRYVQTETPLIYDCH